MMASEGKKVNVKQIMVNIIMKSIPLLVNVLILSMTLNLNSTALLVM